MTVFRIDLKEQIFFNFSLFSNVYFVSKIFYRFKCLVDLKQTVNSYLVEKHLNFAKDDVEWNIDEKSESKRNLQTNHPKDPTPTNGSNLLIDQGLRLVASKPFIPDDSIEQSDIESNQNGAEMKQILSFFRSVVLNL